ncbi:S41 family peptidase [Schleiferilactobacillus perolens]|jgi:hypothetical protein|uniref:S41 family peptidase n=1 Tax=Schleiferilactobacillus perolens TaxID=100468 RepID=UPI0023547BF6|nr:S41 family peptidase [Schleiferilactobacillus perolens]MCI2170878.1 S41 family peptidase [Schleiferilactobacillus perolens]
MKRLVQYAKVAISACFVLLLFSYVSVRNGNITTIQESAVEVIAYMNTNGIINHPAEWRKAVAAVNQGRSIKSIPQLNSLLKIANKHSSAIPSVNQQYAVEKMPTKRSVDGLTIINIPSFHGLDKPQKRKYISTLASDVENTRGPIVLNLAGNTGGDTESMIDGLAALIPNGLLWTEVAKKGKQYRVSLTKDGLGRLMGGSVKNTFKMGQTEKKKLTTKVAVIMDNWSASAAEFTIMALKKNPHVKLFGVPSAGFTSANTSKMFYSPLSENSWAIDTWVAVCTVGTVKCDQVANAMSTHVFNNTPIVPDFWTARAPVVHTDNPQKQWPIDETVLTQVRNWFAEKSALR